MGFSFGKSSGGGKPRAGFNIGGAGEDPLAGVEYTGNLGEDCATEFSALQSEFADRAKKERKRFQDATDSEFWFAVCFKTRDEKEAFLRALGVKPKLMGDKYLDGVQLAKLMGIELE
ncbi:hypothetical protein [Corynebacterium pygosceleis]|uniref:hypothetical protein n=1 Tax=Corynebacterium pygosceleis TaxID=2800406 RepID=UPI0020051AD6|nr:hypothetical protein [Corynebacterium pygosceleis]MCK7676346.1 hypothetical protein [Corynebacterium pygosceleis]